jgi:hypothetical protein
MQIKSAMKWVKVRRGAAQCPCCIKFILYDIKSAPTPSFPLLVLSLFLLIDPRIITKKSIDSSQSYPIICNYNYAYDDNCLYWMESKLFLFIIYFIYYRIIGEQLDFEVDYDL